MEALIRPARLDTVRMRLSDPPSGAALSDAKPSEAQALRAALRAEIEQALRDEFTAQAEARYDSELERARVEGAAAGLAEAKAAAWSEFQKTLATVEADASSALSAMMVAHQAVLARLEASVGEVTFAAVCRLVGIKASAPELVFSLVEQTCAQLRAESVASARMHPRDIEALRQMLQAPALQDNELRLQSLSLTLIADESLALGGCVVEAASGRYDGGLESQLRRLHEVLVGQAGTITPVAGG